MAGTCDTRRSRMPVRLTIHSSSVSRNVDRSALDRTAGGMHLPQPVMAAWFMGDRPGLVMGRGAAGWAAGSLAQWAGW